MSEQPPNAVTQLLQQWHDGSDDALEQLTPLVYNELRSLARHYMRGERAGHMLQTTALVHEAYMKLVGLETDWQDRVHFYAVAARMMRRVLVDFARERESAKRGAGAPHVALEESLVANQPAPDILALDQALEALAKIDKRKAQVVELRFFAGLTIAETTEALGLSHATVERDLKMAKAWLSRELQN